MNWFPSWYTLPLYVQVVPALFLLGVAWRRRPAPGSTPLAFLLASLAYISLTTALELDATEFRWKVFFSRAEYLAYPFVPIGWLAVGLQYSGRGHWLTPTRLAALCLAPATTLLLVATDDWHHWMRLETGLETGAFGTLEIHRGPFFAVHIGYSYLLSSAGAYLLIDAALRGSSLYRRQAFALLAGVLVCWLFNVLHILDLDFDGLDLTPYGITCTLLFFGISLYYYRAFDVIPVARDAIVDGIPDGVLVLDAKGRVVDANAAAAQILECSADEIVGKDLRDLRRADSRLLERLQSLAPIGETALNMVQIGEKSYELRATILQNRRKQPIGRLIQLRDVSERKRDMERLQRSEAERAEAHRLARLGRWDWDILRGEVRMAPELSPILAVDSNLEKMSLEKFFAFVHPEDVDEVRRAVRTAMETGGRVSAVHRVIRADGQIRYVEGRGQAVADETGKPIRMFGVVQDITELKLAEQAARESENKYRALMEQASDGIVVCDFEGSILAVNSMACELLGYDREELLQLHLSDLVLPREADEKPIQPDRLAAGVDLLVERRLRRKDGFPLTVEASATMLEDGRVQIIARDISDRKAAEEERRRLEEKMRQAQKLESLGVLAGGIAHDFNNLLVGVLGNAGLALMEVDDHSPAREYIESIETAAIRAADLCRQMLAYSGKGAFVIQPLDLSLLAQEMLGLMKVSISKKVQLDGDFSRGLPLIHADATQVRQVVMNLVTNAGEAMDEKGGVLSIRTGIRRIDDAYRAGCYMHEAPLTDECVFLSVSDSGVGMDEATRSRIFDPFFTTKFTGRGLGLAAVLGIVRGHRGGIRVDSEPGRGTTFTVLFPARPPVSASPFCEDAALHRGAPESRLLKALNNGRGRHPMTDAHHL